MVIKGWRSYKPSAFLFLSLKNMQASPRSDGKPENPADNPHLPPAQTITLQALFTNLEKVRGFVAQYAEAYGLKPGDVHAVQLAVDEALTNIIEHAYGGETWQEEVECSCQITEEGLVVTLRDYGQSFNPLEISEPDTGASLEDREIGGLGLYFVHQLMDVVDFSFIPPSQGEKGCNLIKMVKRREAAH